MGMSDKHRFKTRNCPFCHRETAVFIKMRTVVNVERGDKHQEAVYQCTACRKVTGFIHE